MRRKGRSRVEVYRYKGTRQFSWLKTVLAAFLAGIILFVSCLTCVLLGSRAEVEGESEIMVVLGCMVYPWGPSILLQDRLNTALSYLDEHPDTTVVVSGGQGADEHMSEAQAMHDYLVEHGFPSAQIILEECSSNTYENLIFTTELLEEMGYDTDGGVVVVSNGFHLTRVRMLWERVTGREDNLNTLAAPSSHQPSRLKMYIREPLALVKSFVFDR